MADAGLPTIPGSQGTVQSAAEAVRLAAEVGYPVMLKASAGGGGRGMRQVEGPDQVERAFLAASSEAEAAFGNGELYLEKVVVKPHHIEVQVLGDGAGGVLTLGERDCSIQRRHQKVLEESPSPLLDAAARERLQVQVQRACSAIAYTGAGTLEFLADERRDFYFMEMNTRVQVEHPVSEMVTGVDVIQEQIRIAAGEPVLGTGAVGLVGHAMEFRINAEDPAAGFLPRGGRVERLILPGGPGVRVDTHLYEGYTVPTNYDSLLAKVIVWDRDRASCIARGLRCLDELVIEGVPTTRSLQIDILRHPAFVEGRFSTAFLEEAGDELPSMRSHVSVGRRKARREAVVVLYQGDLLGLTPRAALERAEGTEPVADPYTRRLVLGVGEHMQAIDDVVSRHLAGWTLERLGSVERSILRIGAFELGWAPDVPTAVIVDEAVELAKRFASDEAGSLVNGVLAAVQGTLRMGEEYTPGP